MEKRDTLKQRISENKKKHLPIKDIKDIIFELKEYMTFVKENDMYLYTTVYDINDNKDRLVAQVDVNSIDIKLMRNTSKGFVGNKILNIEANGVIQFSNSIDDQSILLQCKSRIKDGSNEEIERHLKKQIRHEEIWLEAEIKAAKEEADLEF